MKGILSMPKFNIAIPLPTLFPFIRKEVKKVIQK